VDNELSETNNINIQKEDFMNNFEFKEVA